ncbi:MAG: hypothetical protein FJW86_11190 [Actinobacteria bacterium]|nr:hypothetical protein [Actinomycetota bacterium]
MEDPAVTRAAALAGLGQRRRPNKADTTKLADAFTSDDDPRVRAVALAALVRSGTAHAAVVTAWERAVADPDAKVRRRAADLAPALAKRATPDTLAPRLVELLADKEVVVVEAAAWALGELGDALDADADAVTALARTATNHKDALAREAAVAALGAIGDAAGLPAVLTACRDKPAVRRRAVLALAPFEGPEVEAALQAALEDKDWQVRQAAEDLTT